MRAVNRTATGRIVMRPRWLGNTPIAATAIVTPTDPRTGEVPVTIRFDDVVATGITSVASSSSGLPPPEGFLAHGDHYELVTTARFARAELRFRHDGTSEPVIAQLENGRWTILATTRASRDV